MDGCWALTPVKRLDAAKSRLAGVLGPGERRSLVLALLEHISGAVAGCPALAGWVVVTRDGEVAGLVGERGATVVWEAGSTLNEAVAQGCREAAARGADGVLVLPCDLPLIEAAEITRLVRLGASFARGVVVVPCARKDGTNALLLKPPGIIPPAFGPGSFRRHVRLAASAGGTALCVPGSPLAYDLDVPEDLGSVPSWLAEKLPERLPAFPLTSLSPDHRCQGGGRR